MTPEQTRVIEMAKEWRKEAKSRREWEQQVKNLIAAIDALPDSASEIEQQKKGG